LLWRINVTDKTPFLYLRDIYVYTCINFYVNFTRFQTPTVGKHMLFHHHHYIIKHIDGRWDLTKTRFMKIK
jgi:hypothetical protein